MSYTTLIRARAAGDGVPLLLGAGRPRQEDDPAVDAEGDRGRLHGWGVARVLRPVLVLVPRGAPASGASVRPARAVCVRRLMGRTRVRITLDKKDRKSTRLNSSH